MSYILDALRKAERERHLASVPTLESLHRRRVVGRRRQWPWVIVGALLVNAAILILVLRPAPPVVSRGSSEKPGETTVQASAPAAPERAVSDPAAKPSLEAHADTQAGAPRATPAPRNPPAARPTPLREPSAASRPKAEGQAPAARPAPGMTSPSPPKPADQKPLADEATKRAPEPSPPPAVVSVRSGDPASGRAGTLPSLQDMPGAFQEAVAPIKLDVLVYSRTAGERMVFINARKYLEGQKVEGKILVEEITQDGVILSFQGRRFLLGQ